MRVDVGEFIDYIILKNRRGALLFLAMLVKSVDADMVCKETTHLLKRTQYVSLYTKRIIVMVAITKYGTISFVGLASSSAETSDIVYSETAPLLK